MPPKPDLSFTSLEEFINEPAVENSKAKANEAKPKAVRKNNGALIIEDWVLDSEEENVSQTKIEKKIAKPSFVKIDFVKAKQTNKTDRNTAKQRLGSNFEMFNNARQVNAAYSKTTVNAARPKINTVKDKNVNVARPKAIVNVARPKVVVNVVKGNNVNAVKASACWGNPQVDLQDQGVTDSGCSRHMTWNMSYLTHYEEIDGGYVTFGGNPKGEKIIIKAFKDEISGILKSFKTGIDNIIDHKVKVIRCDNGTKFKNREMNKLCEKKGILRQYSVARTPQQNGVAEWRKGQ
ncbi:putative ribonuclease H-like domain-containing protein [Tanacetum coccineum]